MKKICTYLVFKDDTESGAIELYHISKSKNAARKEFRTRAYNFLLNNPDQGNQTIKLRLMKVLLDKPDYTFIIKVKDFHCCEKCSEYISDIINNIWYSTEWKELGMVNDKTFELDFLPYFCHKAGIHPYDLKIEGVLEKILINPNSTIYYWVNRYLHKTF